MYNKLYLFGIAVGLTALHLLLIWRLTSDIDQMIINVLFWGAFLCLLWRKQDILNLDSGILSSFFGLLLIALVFVKSISLFWVESYFLKIFPLMAAIGLGLMASGIKGLKQYWRELIIALLLCIPDSLLVQIIEELCKVTTSTAKFAAFVLWYTGFQVSRQGANITLSSGSVVVSTLCTGISTALLLLKLSVVFILMFPTDWLKKILVPIGAIFIAFVTSGFRVALMALVVSNHQAFSYWHGGEGNQIFSTIAILIFGLFCRFLLQSEGKQGSRGAGEQWSYD
jgi:cyanoexosortase A